MDTGEVRIDDIPVFDTEVLVVGAGPTGLMAGLMLSRRGVATVLIDRKSGPTHESKALAVQSRTMEIYDQLGLAEKVLAGALSCDDDEDRLDGHWGWARRRSDDGRGHPIRRYADLRTEPQ